MKNSIFYSNPSEQIAVLMQVYMDAHCGEFEKLVIQSISWFIHYPPWKHVYLCENPAGCSTMRVLDRDWNSDINSIAGSSHSTARGQSASISIGKLRKTAIVNFFPKFAKESLKEASYVCVGVFNCF
ncbi:MAG: hypothetical protein ACFFD4_12635 [Candidatus Odinarchaeota archaeon]